MDSQDHQAAANTPLVLCDSRMPGQRRKDLRGVVSRETAVIHRSARAIMSNTPTTTMRVDYVRYSTSRHKPCDGGKQGSAELHLDRT